MDSEYALGAHPKVAPLPLGSKCGCLYSIRPAINIGRGIIKDTLGVVEVRYHYLTYASILTSSTS